MTRFRRHLAATAGALGIAAIVAGTATAATVTNFDTGNPEGQPLGIVAGPNGNMWFADPGANSVSQLTPGGTVFPNAYVGAQGPAQIAFVGGSIWATEGGSALPTPASAVTRVTPGGTASRFPVAASNLQGIAGGADGNVYFVSQDADALFRVTPSGTVSGPFATAQGGPPPATQGTGPKGITAGPAGDTNVYIATETGVSAANTSGTPAPNQIASVNQAQSIVTGPDGQLWVGTANGVEHVARSGGNLGGGVGIPGGNVRAITVGPDGALWFAESSRDAVGRLTTGGDYSEIPVPGCDNPSGIAAGPGGIYATCFGAEITPGGNTTGHTIARIVPDAAGGGGGGVVPPPLTPPKTAKVGGTFTLKGPVIAGKKFTVSVKFNKPVSKSKVKVQYKSKAKKGPIKKYKTLGSKVVTGTKARLSVKIGKPGKYILRVTFTNAGKTNVLAAKPLTVKRP